VRHDFSLVADRATMRNGKLYIEGGAFTRIDFNSLPAQTPSIALVARFWVETGDDEIPHEVGVRLRDPSGAIIGESDAPMPPDALTVPEGEPPGSEVAVVVVASLAIDFEHAGVHAVDLYLDGELIKSHPIEVRVRSEKPVVQVVEFEIDGEPISVSARDAARMVEELRAEGASDLAGRIERASQLNGQATITVGIGEDERLLAVLEKLRATGDYLSALARLERALRVRIDHTS
jgi:hypothetical protein